MADILDGTSNTLVGGERSSKWAPSTWVGMVTGGDHAPARITGIGLFPPNSEQEEEHYTHNFSSYHPTGTNFVLGDGSVRLISETIDRMRLPGDSVREPDQNWCHSSDLAVLRAREERRIGLVELVRCGGQSGWAERQGAGPGRPVYLPLNYQRNSTPKVMPCHHSAVSSRRRSWPVCGRRSHRRPVPTARTRVGLD